YEGIPDPSRASEMLQRLRSEINGLSSPNRSSDAIDQILDLLQKNDLEGLQKALSDPRVQEQLRQTRPDDPDFRRRIEEKGRRMAEQGQNFDAEKLQQLLRNLQSPRPGLPPSPLNPVPGGPNAQQPRPLVPPTPPSGPDAMPPLPPRLPPPGSGSAEDSKPSDRFREFLGRATRWLPESFRQSEAVERFRQNLMRGEAEGRDRTFRLPGNIRLGLDLNKRLSRSFRWAESALGRIRVGRMPSVQLPDLSRSPSVPTWGGPGNVSGLKSTGLIIGLLGAVVLASLLAWRFMNPESAGNSSTVASSRATWPVDPQRIATRDELVRAFDYLTVWRVGPIAAPWHHRRRAQSLAELESSRRTEAFRLAELYETARYAPPDEAIPESAMTQARKDLLALAGAEVP
ncbi:MAG: hypothetical protein N2039_15875, partial [Gemmataceae bacterium]|nr:hypothetical protein [Gemmataceae bacterium]